MRSPRFQFFAHTHTQGLTSDEGVYAYALTQTYHHLRKKLPDESENRKEGKMFTEKKLGGDRRENRMAQVNAGLICAMQSEGT